MKILAITQARYGSTRLPAKILKKVNGMTLLEIHLRRILQSKLISKLKVATTNEEGAGPYMQVEEKERLKFAGITTVIILLTPAVIEFVLFMLMPGLRY